MFRPNTTGLLQSRLGFDKHGEPKLGPARSVPCAVAVLNSEIAETPIRATASASQASAEENLEVAMIMFPASVAISAGDVLAVSGMRLRAIGVLACNDVFGKLDHYEVKFGAWRQ